MCVNLRLANFVYL